MVDYKKKYLKYKKKYLNVKNKLKGGSFNAAFVQGFLLNLIATYKQYAGEDSVDIVRGEKGQIDEVYLYSRGNRDNYVHIYYYYGDDGHGWFYYYTVFDGNNNLYLDKTGHEGWSNLNIWDSADNMWKTLNSLIEKYTEKYAALPAFLDDKDCDDDDFISDPESEDDDYN